VSGDEIVFGEVSYREPARVVRPDKDVNYACTPFQQPGAGDLPIFLDYRAADAMDRHALSDTTVELGGILLGKECVDPASGTPFVWITESLEAKHYANTQASFTYTHDSWEEITRERDKRFPDLDIVGWYHTHPSFGIFLSHHDLFIHQNFFAQPLQIAYVVDPIQYTRGMFQWRDAKMVQVDGFHLTAPRQERMALSRVANTLEQFPSSQDHGGALMSPRLEAELIKMLSRPNSSRSGGDPSERLPFAVLYALLGAFLGVLGVTLVLWLNQIQAQLLDQGEALRSLSESVKTVSDRQGLAVDALLEHAGTENPTRFADRYQNATKARDEARQKLQAQLALNETLAEQYQGLKADATQTAKDLDTARKALEKYQDPKGTDLFTRLASLEKTKTALEAELAEKTAIAETAEGKKAEAVLDDLSFYRRGSYLLGSLCLLLGCLAGYLWLRWLGERPMPLDDRPIPTETHRIT
jgi:proteasome lid subunit RPN8/RPN11